jgi:hypothetical protein
VIPHDIRFPDRVDPGLMPGGIVIRVYRWRDGAVMVERRLATVDDALDAEVDADQMFQYDTAPVVGGTTRAYVIVGYDGDDGTAMIPPALFTDDPDLAVEHGGG